MRVYRLVFACGLLVCMFATVGFCQEMRGTLMTFSSQHPDMYGYSEALKNNKSSRLSETIERCSGLFSATLGPGERPVFVGSGGGCDGNIHSAETFNSWFQIAQSAHASDFTDPSGHRPFNLKFDFDANSGEWFSTNLPAEPYFTLNMYGSFILGANASLTAEFTHDLLIYINGALVDDFDRVGLGPTETVTVWLDDLDGSYNLEPGKPFDLQVFHAQRDPFYGKQFRISHNLELNPETTSSAPECY